MKKVSAYIKRHKLSDVIIALHEIEELTGMTVSDVRGCGRGFHVVTEAGNVESLDRHTKIEIMCSDDLVERIVDTIQHAAHTGLR
ncbi:MAG: P-II family nitrogen regulator, partial [Thermoanaerobaculales bacterium]